MTGPEEPMERIFRQHNTAPGGVVSPLYRQLTQEWAHLHTTPSTTATVRRWGRKEPALAGFTSPGQIVDAIDAADHEHTNELLLALLRRFQDGHQLAGRIVLHALLPKLAKIANHANALCTSSSDTHAEDRRSITLAECWDVMATYPLERRTSSVASNLALDTLHRITGARRPAPELPVDPHEDRDNENLGSARRAWLTGHATTDPHPEEELTADSDLQQVIGWGMGNGTITPAEAQLLVTSYLPERITGFGFADAAAQLGLTQTAVRQRCSRAARKLAAAIRDDITASAPAAPVVA